MSKLAGFGIKTVDVGGDAIAVNVDRGTNAASIAAYLLVVDANAWRY